jgi:adenylate cyclase
MTSNRKLAAILAADVVGFSTMMQADEAGTLAALKQRRKEVLEPLVAKHRGRLVKVMGDGVLIEFASAVAAVQCAVELQQAMGAANAANDPNGNNDKSVVLRIGVNLGDVLVEGSDLYGDGVNVAARLEALAEPGAICISGKVREEVQGKLELSIEDRGEVTMKNMPRRVRVFRIDPIDDRIRGRSRDKALALPSKPSIAVLPFTNMSGDPEQQYFGDGVVEDIITELSRFRSLFVIARNSSFAFRGERIDIAEIARRLGVQFVVEGSIRRAGNRVRITAQLIDATTGAHLWAERYEREMEDIFTVQDEVVRTVVATVAGRVEAAGAELAKRKPPESLAAYDYLLRGLEQLSLVGEAHNAEARRLFEKAVELDPEYAAAHAYLALAIYVEWQDSRDPLELERALASARRALALDENDSRCHRILSTIYIYLRQYDRAEFHSDRSIALNPNDALAALYRAGLLRRLGRAEEGVEWARRAMRLNPYHPNWYWDAFANVLHTAGRYAEALEAYGRIVERPSFYHAYVAACHAELGQIEEAQRHAALALQVKPDFSVSTWGERLPFKYEADLQRFLAGMRKAGLPE